jgi:hypothetical protein
MKLSYLNSLVCKMPFLHIEPYWWRWHMYKKDDRLGENAVEDECWGT